MPRNPGSEVDLAHARIRDRDGRTYEVERLDMSTHGIYYARPILGHRFLMYHERWILPDPGLSISRWIWGPESPQHLDWYIEPDIVRHSGSTVSIADGYIDIEVYEGVRYEVDDIDEFTEALEHGEIPPEEALAVLRSFHAASRALRSNGFSGAALLRSLAPDLPH